MVEVRLPDLPEPIIEHARQLIEQGESHQWVVGDYLVGVVDELAEFYARLVDPDQACKHIRKGRAHIISQIADRTGTDRSTLRDREVMARFYRPDLRAEYAPLTYHQLRACKSAGDDWVQYAEWALNNLPAPPAIIRLRIKHNGDIPPSYVGRWSRMVKIAEDIIKDRDKQIPPRYIEGICRLIITVYDYYSE